MMQFDWTTFILEILNFLVLIWILQRLIYKPVLAMLDARQQRIHDETARAEQLHGEAEALRQQYELRLSEWAQERESSRRQLDEELAKQREIALENLKQTLADEEAKLRARDAALTVSRETALIREAATTAYTQTAAMLQRLASPQLTQRIAAIFLEDLAQLPESDGNALHKAAAMLIPAYVVEITSAHPLNETDREALRQGLSAAAGRDLQFSFQENTELIAGIRAVVGECQLHANLGDELAFFRRQANHV